MTGTTGPQSVRAADQHFRAAEDALRRGEYERAASEFTYCIQLNPSRPVAFARRGDVWRVLGRFESAISDYTAYLQADPNNGPVALARGQMYVISGNYNAAIADFGTAIAQDATNGNAYLSRGQALTRVGQPHAAVADFTRAVELSPGNAMAFVERGTALLASGDPFAALPDLTRAIQLNPFLGLAFARRADAQVALGHHDRAVADLSESLRLDPLNADLYATRGEAQLKLNASAAVADMDEAIRLAPDVPDYVARRGLAFLKLGRLEQAEEDLTGAIATGAPNHVWFRARGETRLKLSRLDPANADFMEAVRIKSDFGPAYHGQALVYIARNDYILAIPCLDRAIDYSPDLADAYYQRARCHHRLERTDAAMPDLNKSIALDPDAIPARRLRADLLLRAGRSEEAYADLAHLTTRAPDDPMVYHLRGKLEFRRGRLDAAAEDLSTALKLDPAFTEALADRAGVYRALSKHREALADLTAAVQQDAKYAAEYLVQLGITHGAGGQFNQAIADFIVALHLDPGNKAAVRGKDLVTRLRDSQGYRDADSEDSDLERQNVAEHALREGPPAPKRPRAWRSGDSPEGQPLALPRAQKPAERAPKPAPRLPRAAARPQPKLEVDLSVAPTEDTSFEVEAGFDGEADARQIDIDVESTIAAPPARRSPGGKALPKPPDTLRRPVVGRAEEEDEEIPEVTVVPQQSARAANPPQAPAVLAPVTVAPASVVAHPPPAPAPKPTPPKPTPKRRRQDDDDDDDERGLRAKFNKLANSKWGKRLIPAFGVLALTYVVYDQFFSMPSAAGLADRGKKEGYPIAPGNKLSAADFWNEYAKDNKAADEKFADKYVELSGKVRTTTNDTKKIAVVFDTPSDKQSVECLFVVKGEIDGLKTGDQVTIQGEVRHRKTPDDNVVLQVSKVRK